MATCSYAKQYRIIIKYFINTEAKCQKKLSKFQFLVCCIRLEEDLFEMDSVEGRGNVCTNEMSGAIFSVPEQTF